MSQQFNQPQNKIKTSVLVFIKGASMPVVLYVENPQGLYNEILETMQETSNKLIEKNTLGPVKKIAFFSNQISCVALQDEPYQV